MWVICFVFCCVIKFSWIIIGRNAIELRIKGIIQVNEFILCIVHHFALYCINLHIIKYILSIVSLFKTNFIQIPPERRIKYKIIAILRAILFCQMSYYFVAYDPMYKSPVGIVSSNKAKSSFMVILLSFRCARNKKGFIKMILISIW